MAPTSTGDGGTPSAIAVQWGPVDEYVHELVFSGPGRPLQGSSSATDMENAIARAALHRSSITWSESSGDLGAHSDVDEVEDRSDFVNEYNKLAKKVCPMRT